MPAIELRTAINCNIDSYLTQPFERISQKCGLATKLNMVVVITVKRSSYTCD